MKIEGVSTVNPCTFGLNGVIVRDQSLTGTSFSVQSRQIVGTNSLFTTEVAVNDLLLIGGDVLTVTRIIDDTHLVVEKPCAQLNGLASMTNPTQGARISTAITSRFGTSCLRVDTTNAFKFTGISDNVNHFTIEFWYYVDSLAAVINIIDTGTRNIKLTFTTSNQV